MFGGFAPNSSSAEVLSKALGSRTVMSGSVSRKVEYAEKKEILDGIVQKYHRDWLIQEVLGEDNRSAGGQNQAESWSHDPQQTALKKTSGKKATAAP